MTPRLLRIVYAFEFLLALVAIFTVWSEVGGQAALDLMHWAWKLGLSLALAITFVLYTAAVASEESLWTARSARWLAVMLIIFLGMSVVTYYYSMEADTGESDESGTISRTGSACSTTYRTT